MRQVIIVKTGESYSSDQFCFEKEADALEFFKTLGKAKKLTRDYISGGIGSLFTESSDVTKASLTYGTFCTEEELKYLKAEEDARLKEAAKLEAKKDAEVAAIEPSEDFEPDI